MSHFPQRRRIARVLAFSAASVITIGALTSCAAEAADSGSDAGSDLSGQVIFADYGGPTNESRQVSFFESFYEETGVEVISDAIVEATMFEMFEGGEGDYDLIQASPDYVLTYGDNLLSLPSDVTVNDMMPEEVQDKAVGGFVFAVAQAWLTETYPDGGPQDWVDFFDTETFPGKRAWPGSPWSFDSSFEIALLADGVAPEDLYPLDLERATAKLDTIRDDLVFYESYAETQTLLTSGTAAIAVSVNGQFTSLINQGVDVTVQWNQAFPSPAFFVVPAKAPNPENAWALANWMADPDNQAVFVERTGYGPATSDVLDLLSDDLLANLPTTAEHLEIAVVRDEEYIAENYSTLLDTYTAWLGQ